MTNFAISEPATEQQMGGWTNCHVRTKHSVLQGAKKHGLIHGSLVTYSLAGELMQKQLSIQKRD